MEFTAYDITLFIYNLSLVPVIFFSVLFILLALINIFVENKKTMARYRKFDRLPFVTVQIPTYNDPVAERCVRQCLKFDYPKNKYEIIIADDSTNAETQNILKSYSVGYGNLVKYIQRDNRDNFKPGALKNAMRRSKGEIIVVFDADWIPARDFLRKIIKPFSDPKIAVVQSRQGVYNQNKNIITRFATYIMWMYHQIIMPISNKINCVFFCGTAGAIRRSAFEDAGGWNLKSITEDADLSVNLLLKGYKTVYLEFETPSEVPDTFEGFIKQQMRWCYGNARVFIDNASAIISSKNLNTKQKLMIIYVTLGNAVAPIIVMMTFFGFAGWFLGDIKLFGFSDLINFLTKFAYTSGFIVIGVVTLYRKRKLREFPNFLLSGLTVGIITSVANSIAFTRAVANKKLHWFCTPKAANESFMENENS